MPDGVFVLLLGALVIVLAFAVYALLRIGK